MVLWKKNYGTVVFFWWREEPSRLENISDGKQISQQDDDESTMLFHSSFYLPNADCWYCLILLIRGPVTLTAVAECLAAEQLLPQNFCMLGEWSNQLHHHRGSFLCVSGEIDLWTITYERVYEKNGLRHNFIMRRKNLYLDRKLILFVKFWNQNIYRCINLILSCTLWRFNILNK